MTGPTRIGLADEPEDGDGFGDEDAGRGYTVTTASWAIAARDAAIDHRDWARAATFAEQAREAIEAAGRAGISRAQLAYELDYPGGAAAMDGEQIDNAISNEDRPGASQTAAQEEADEQVVWPQMPEWMREQSRRTENEFRDSSAPPARVDDRAEIVGRLMALREQVAASPTGSTEGPVSADAAARRLAHDGLALDDTRALVRRYLNDASLRLGVPVEGWGLDDADLDAIRAGVATPVPTPRESSDDEARRAQLALWHDDASGGADALGVARGREWP